MTKHESEHREHPRIWPYDEAEREIYWPLVKQAAKAMVPPTDGCTGVPDWYVEACWEHDLHYRYGRKLLLLHFVKDEKNQYRLELGEKITQHWADTRLKQSIRSLSWLAYLSPVACWRWFGLSKVGLGRSGWERHRSLDPHSWRGGHA